MTLTKTQEFSNVVMHTETVILLEDNSPGLNNFVYLSRRFSIQRF